MDLLIVFKDGVCRVVRDAKGGNHNRDTDMYMIEKGGLTALIPRENVRYFGPKEIWGEVK